MSEGTNHEAGAVSSSCIIASKVVGFVLKCFVCLFSGLDLGLIVLLVCENVLFAFRLVWSSVSCDFWLAEWLQRGGIYLAVLLFLFP